MLLLMTDVPSHVVGARAVGKVDKADYESKLLPEFERVVKQHGKINFIMVLETSVGNFTPGAWMDDVKAGIKHFTKWNKIAIVTDQGAVQKFTDFFSAIVPGEAKGYPLSDIELAKAWVSVPNEAPE